MSNTDELKHFAFNFLVAGCTGAAVKTFTAPADRIKVILQTQNSVSQVLEGNRKMYSGIVDCIIRIPQEQGVFSFWRGNWLNIMRYFPTQALVFSLNDVISNLIRQRVSADHQWTVRFISGGTAGALTTLLMYPLEYCQTRITADVGSDKIIGDKRKFVGREFFGMNDCISKTSRRNGVKGFYFGSEIATIGTGCYRMISFGLYDSAKRMMKNRHKDGNSDDYKLPISQEIVIAQAVTMLASTVCYPLDTIGRRMMLEVAKSKHKQRFHNTLGATKMIYAEDGIRSFYKGVLANYLKCISGALVLVFYDEITNYFYKKL